MTKFEEELNKIEVEVQTPLDKYIVEKATSDESLYAQHYEAVLEKFKDWHSDEEFQELLSKYSGLNHNYEKEVIRSSKLESQIVNLKSQLQQQALPVVPECVAGAIESIPDHYSAFEAIDLIKSKVEVFTEENKDWLQVYNWLCEGIENQDIFALAFITGNYQVEKPQLFYLKHIDFCKTDKHYDWFTIKHSDGPLNHLRVEKGQKPSTIDCKFTQQEIDSMQTGSYELVPVEDGE